MFPARLASAGLIGLFLAFAPASAQTAARAIALDDLAKLKTVGDPQVSPDGKWVEPWIRISYPFLHADRIKTPTLFLGGEKDFNVPIVGGEQMYQALKSLNVETQLIVYPGQFHTITTPSYLRDRLERYLAWFNKFVKAGE